MRGSGMHRAEHDLKAIMYPAEGTNHILRIIRGNKIHLTQNPSEWNNDSTSNQSRLPLLTQLKCGAAYNTHHDVKQQPLVNIAPVDGMISFVTKSPRGMVSWISILQILFTTLNFNILCFSMSSNDQISKI